jgi:hypothetical protein
MLSAMSIDQFRMWVAYAGIEPFGEEREDYRAGTVASVIANVHRDPKHKPSPFQPSDFFRFGVDDGPTQEASKAMTDPKEWNKMLGRFKVIYGNEKGVTRNL